MSDIVFDEFDDEVFDQNENFEQKEIGSSNIYNASDFIEFSYEGKKNTHLNEKGFKLLLALMIIIGVLVLFYAAFYLVSQSVMNKPTVIYKNLKELTVQDMNNAAGTLLDSTWIGFDREKMLTAVSMIPSVESASIEKIFPNKIIVNVSERTPVAKSIINIDGKAVPVQIDKNGVLFHSRNNDVVHDSTIPLLSGLEDSLLKAGMYVPLAYRNLVKQIEAVKNVHPKYFAVVSEIKIVPKDHNNFELVVYPSKSNVKVLLDHTLDAKALENMMVVLDVVKFVDTEVSQIDLRYGTISYK